MTPEELYKIGYRDGLAGTSASPSHVNDANYSTGYEDGKGDRSNPVLNKDNKSRYIEEDYYELYAPPAGYEWTRVMRTPQKGEIYLTKNGNAGIAKVPANGRRRHILQAERPCSYRSWDYKNATDSFCKLARGHRGKHSNQI